VPRAAARGQSLAEFTLILPIILILLLAVADFGRVYATGITMESSARAAAETAAIEYFREFMAVNPAPMDAAAYSRVHRAAWSSICDEAAAYPNATPGSGGSQCDGLPTVVCVHDGLDPGCGNLYNSTTTPPGGCPALAAGTRPSNTQGAQAGLTETSKWVEVRLCYRFTTIMSMTVPFIGGSMTALGGQFDLERARTFTVADY
jgi:hypothetical protein